jgi:hypothetical protein
MTGFGAGAGSFFSSPEFEESGDKLQQIVSEGSEGRADGAVANGEETSRFMALRTMT